MKIWKTLTKANEDLMALHTFSSVTIGNFDGVHRGHQTIIKRTVELARQLSGQAVVISFTNHTAGALGQEPLLLNQPEIREELLSKLGLDALLTVKFNKEFASLSPETFFKKWLMEGLKAQVIVVGYDFRFGAAGRGDYQLLQQLCETSHTASQQIAAVAEEGRIISSSTIRQLIRDGNIELANKMLGYPFELAGTVTYGEQRGRRLGFPTANIHVEPQYLLPAFGVYVTEFTVGFTTYYGIANVGVKPTFGTFASLIEVNLFDTSLDLYGKKARVKFLKFLRREIRFPDAEALKKQVAEDIRIAHNFIREIREPM